MYLSLHAHDHEHCLRQIRLDLKQPEPSVIELIFVARPVKHGQITGSLMRATDSMDVFLPIELEHRDT